MSIHSGHRKRLKARYLAEGLDHFEQHEVLELLLFYCLPRQDTNPIAHRLIDRFGNLSQVLATPPEELMKVEGMGPGAAMFLSLLHDLDRYCMVHCARQEQILQTLNQCGEFLTPYFRNLRNETVYLLCLDAKCKVLACKEVGEGSINSAAIPIRRVVEMALAEKATSVVLAHNHPSGLAYPSHEDVATTQRVSMALHAVEILLADHIVVADDDFVSMVQSGLYRPEECVPTV